MSLGKARVVDKRQLLALADADALSIFRKGELAWVYAHLLSWAPQADDCRASVKVQLTRDGAQPASMARLLEPPPIHPGCMTGCVLSRSEVWL